MAGWARLACIGSRLWRLLSSPRLAAGLFLGLGLYAAAGTFLPQKPPELSFLAWMGMIQERYGPRASLYGKLGLFDVYHSPLFVVLAGALATNTLACTIRRGISIWRATQRLPQVIQGDRYYQRLKCHTAFTFPPLVQALEAAQSVLKHHRYRITTARRGVVNYLYGEADGWARWATLFTHGAVVSLMATLLVRGSLAWRELRVQLVSGQVYRVGHNTPWEVRLDGFSARALADEQSVEYQAQLTLLAQGQPVAQHWARVNSPLCHGALKVYLFSFGPAVRVQAESESQPVSLQPLPEGETEGVEEVFLPLSNAGQGQALVIPSRSLRLHFSPQVGGGLFVEVTQGKGEELLWSDSLPAGGRIEVADLLIKVRREAVVVVDIVHDPSFLPAIISAALMVGGLSCTFAFPTRQLWLKLGPGELWIAGRASRDPVGFECQFRRLEQEIGSQIAGAEKDVGDG